MTDSVKENFNVPPGFSVEEIKGQLYYEDLEEDDELWLVRMPSDVELSTLDRRKILLSNDTGSTSVKNFKTEQGRSLECYAETGEISNTCVVLPRRQDGQLHVVKKVFKGSVLISEALTLNDEMEIKSEKEDDHVDNNSSFITDSEEGKSIMKIKNSHSNLDTSDLNIKYEIITQEQHEDINNSTTKKRKSAKKKKHSQIDFDSSDLNYETETAESVNSPNSQKKLLKKYSNSWKKSSERLEIKDELISMDLEDEFPTCSSQK